MPSGVADVEALPRGASPKTEKHDSPPRTEGPPENESSSKDSDRRRQTGQDEEGVEVVLGERGKTTVIDTPETNRPTPDQNVFRHPQAVRPRPMRAPSGPPPPHSYHSSGSWGYGPPPPHYPPPPHPHEYGAHRPYPVPPYASSGSFEDKGGYHHPTPHYSPHVHYPPPGGRYSEDVNVISPNHKSEHPQYRSNLPARPRQMHPHAPHHPYYQYPPASPVSRPGGSSLPSGPPRIRNYAMRRNEGPYSKAQRGDKNDGGGAWSSYPSPQRSSSNDMNRRQPQLVAEASFDSEHHARRSHPPTPGAGHSGMPPPLPPNDAPYHFYGGAASWGSFESAAGPPPPHFEDHRYYNPPPESPYSSYMAPYSPGGIYQAESFPPPYGYGPTGSFSYSYDEEDRLLRDYHPDRDGEDNRKHVTPSGKGKNRSSKGDPNSASNMLLPKAAEEVDFDVADPPAEPVTPPSTEALCDSMGEVNSYDVLCGRGGGTNSQIGNRRFRKLVQDFQPTYLLARRKEKPLLARTIVLIIRKRGGRFLRKDDDTGALYEVGDSKAEAKTSQALREGLDVRATKSAASSLLEKKKKNMQNDDDDDDLDSEPSPSRSINKSRKAGDLSPSSNGKRETDPPGSPPSLPRLQGEEVKSASMSPDQSMQARKRRRMRAAGSSGNSSAVAVGVSADRFFPDFCPPRAEFGRPPSPGPEDGISMHMSTTPIRRNKSRDDGIRDEDDAIQAQGCTGIALDMVTGAATGSFCLGPGGWRGRNTD